MKVAVRRKGRPDEFVDLSSVPRRGDQVIIDQTYIVRMVTWIPLTEAIPAGEPIVIVSLSVAAPYE